MAKISLDITNPDAHEQFMDFCENNAEAVDFLYYDVEDDACYIECSDDECDYYNNKIDELMKKINIPESDYTINNTLDEPQEGDFGLDESKIDVYKHFRNILVENKNEHFYITRAKFLTEAVSMKDPQLEKMARFSKDYNELTNMYKEYTQVIRERLKTKNVKSTKKPKLKESKNLERMKYLKEGIDDGDVEFVNTADVFNSVVTIITNLAESAGELQQHKQFVFKSNNQKIAIAKLENQILAALSYANEILGGIGGTQVQPDNIQN